MESISQHWPLSHFEACWTADSVHFQNVHGTMSLSLGMVSSMVASQLQICSACLPRQPGTFCRCELQFEVWWLRPWGVAFDVYGADVLVRSCDQQHGKRACTPGNCQKSIENIEIMELVSTLSTCPWDVTGCDQTTLVTSTMHQVSWEL